MPNKIYSFYRRIKNGDISSAIYLVFHYSYLFIYDIWFKTHFANSQSPEETNAPKGGTGNFPINPRIVKKFIDHAQIEKNESIIDIGHGSGMVLHVLYRLGYKNLTGIEYSDIAFEISKNNLKNKAKLIHGNALETNLQLYKTIFFFNPFRGNTAKVFFSNLPDTVKTVITINHDPEIELVLIEKGFTTIYEHQHFIYKNFNGKIWKKNVM